MMWRKYQPEDYLTVAPWFVAHGWPVPPDEGILPSTGIVVESDEGVPIAVGFLYLSNSTLGFMDWLATDPALGKRGFFALKYLISVIHDAAARANMTHILHMTKSKYKKAFTKLGFTPGEELMMFTQGVK